jgi:hypothetical protein
MVRAEAGDRGRRSGPLARQSGGYELCRWLHQTRPERDQGLGGRLVTRARWTGALISVPPIPPRSLTGPNRLVEERQHEDNASCDHQDQSYLVDIHAPDMEAGCIAQDCANRHQEYACPNGHRVGRYPTSSGRNPSSAANRRRPGMPRGHSFRSVAYDEDLANRVRELIAAEQDLAEQTMFGLPS